MKINIWGLEYDGDPLTESQQKYIEFLPKDVPTVEWVFSEMDRVWNECGLDNKKPYSGQDIGSFYGHPVWIMNGIFTEVDSVSIAHRKALVNYCKERDLLKLADYGGGSGVLAEQVALIHKSASVDIIEPYASDFFIKKLSSYTAVNFVSDYECANYDCVIAQDVLEHVENPIETAYVMSSHVKENGYVIFANCFYPLIKCHLPSTFYLRYTFKFVMQQMGLDYIGRLPGAEHALVFQKKGDLNLKKAVNNITKMKLIGLSLNKLIPVAYKVKNLFK